MAKFDSYKGSIDLISGLRQKNNGDFPLSQTGDIQATEDGKRLDELLKGVELDLADTISVEQFDEAWDMLSNGGKVYLLLEDYTRVQATAYNDEVQNKLFGSFVIDGKVVKYTVSKQSSTVTVTQEEVSGGGVEPFYLDISQDSVSVDDFNKAWDTYEAGGNVYVIIPPIYISPLFQVISGKRSMVAQLTEGSTEEAILATNVLQINEDGSITQLGAYVNGITTEERNKLAKALTTPAEAPTSQVIPSITTDNEQQNLTLGEGLVIENGVLKSTATGGGIVVLDTEKTYTEAEANEIIGSLSTFQPVALQSTLTLSVLGQTQNFPFVEMASVIGVDGDYKFLTKGATYEVTESGQTFQISSEGALWTIMPDDSGNLVFVKMGTENVATGGGSGAAKKKVTLAELQSKLTAGNAGMLVSWEWKAAPLETLTDLRAFYQFMYDTANQPTVGVVENYLGAGLGYGVQFGRASIAAGGDANQPFGTYNIQITSTSGDVYFTYLDYNTTGGDSGGFTPRNARVVLSDISDIDNYMTFYIYEGVSTAGDNTVLLPKEITFTDRPSLYEWMLANSDKVIKAVLTVPGMAGLPPVIFNSAQTEGNEVFLTYYYAEALTDGEGGVVEKFGSVSITDTTTYASMAPFNRVSQKNEIVSNSSGTISEVPDSQWSALGISFVVTYLEETSISTGGGGGGGATYTITLGEEIESSMEGIKQYAVAEADFDKAWEVYNAGGHVLVDVSVYYGELGTAIYSVVGKETVRNDTYGLMCSLSDGAINTVIGALGGTTNPLFNDVIILKSSDGAAALFKAVQFTQGKMKVWSHSINHEFSEADITETPILDGAFTKFTTPSLSLVPFQGSIGSEFMINSSAATLRVWAAFSTDDNTTWYPEISRKGEPSSSNTLYTFIVNIDGFDLGLNVQPFASANSWTNDSAYVDFFGDSRQLTKAQFLTLVNKACSSTNSLYIQATALEGGTSAGL